MEELAKHGTMLPSNMMGLTDEQVIELKLKDEWADKCSPMGGWTFNKDVMGKKKIFIVKNDKKIIFRKIINCKK